MKILDFLIKYWSQIAVVVFGLGYIVKLFLQNKYKKIEINHSLFQQNRISTVNNFFSYYAKAELMWNQIAYYSILEHTINVKEIDKMILPTMNDLNRTVLELKMYFAVDDHSYFQRLANGFEFINGKMLDLYINIHDDKSLTVRANEFTRFREEILLNNKVVIDELCLRIRKAFKTKI
jgi:hypothetical protein